MQHPDGNKLFTWLHRSSAPILLRPEAAPIPVAAALPSLGDRPAAERLGGKRLSWELGNPKPSKHPEVGFIGFIGFRALRDV